VLLAPPVHGQTTYRTDTPALDRLQFLMKETLESNRRDFAGHTGPVKGFGAGGHYPQIWLRDSATLIALARYHYPREVLTSWLEEHLAQQNPDGSLNDWVAGGEAAPFREFAPGARDIRRPGAPVLSADRNTSAADQETSAVDAAAQVFSLTEDAAWLRKPVAGRPLVDRLDAALSYVRARRMSPGGLVTAAFTADWGDVSPAHGDQRVIYLDEDTPVVAGLYASALFVRAADALAALSRASGRSARGPYWHLQARRTAAAINARLWQDTRGFYRLHLPLRSPKGWTSPDDSDMFALGGNALAALYGVAGTSQVERIAETAEERRRRYGMSGIGGVLLPPYPAGVFQHPIQKEPFTYQNGGQWEWLAGRFVLAEFRRGQSERARRHLKELAEQAVARGGLFEWVTRDGKGMGSARYAGSAGALGAAVFEGLFGLDVRAQGLTVAVRLGRQDGQVTAEQPATGSRVAYEYRWLEGPRTIRLGFRSNAPGEGRLLVLLPGALTPAEVRKDGTPQPLPRVRTEGRDRYAVFTTDWRPHVLEITLR
jgi:hypothetical protein